ncbi:MAG: hypothetical protein A2176_07915 [Spirochaetes bacterium RBG_13_51_14]|nr:MAG: hypothetical protein A2176_07915 [Spirochaetes bacterium RBG_13_51_14]
MKEERDVLNRDKYVMPGPDEVKCIAPGQTLILVLGSCISTVFIGRSRGYFLAANHIIIAKELQRGVIAKRSARHQIDEILAIFRDELDIAGKDLRCLHLVGAGRKVSGESFRVHRDNIEETRAVLSSGDIDIMFEDIMSYYTASYSLSGEQLSVFIEDKLADIHLSYIIDLERLFAFDPKQSENMPASALKPHNHGFEELVDKGVIVFITGEKNRPDV